MARKEADDVHMLPKWLISTKICAEWYRYLPSAITWDRLLPLVPHKQRECQSQTRHSFSGYGDLHFRNAAGVVIRLSSYAPLPTEISGSIRGKRSTLRVSWQRWRVSKQPLAAHAKLESHTLLTTSLAVLRSPFRTPSCTLLLCSTHSLTKVALCSSFEPHPKQPRSFT